MIQRFLNSRYKAVFIFLLLFPWVLVTITRQSIDYDIFATTAKGWLSGQIHLYDGQTEFYFAPYSILAFVPFVLIPPPFDRLLYTTIILAMLVWAAWTLSKPVQWWMLGIGLATVYTALLVFNGQWDSVVMAALILGWVAVERSNPWLLGLSMIGLGTKPTNVILPTLLLMYPLRNWSKINLARLAVIPVLALIISAIIAGWNWPMTYIQNYRQHPNPPNYVVVTPWTQTLYLRSYWEYLNLFTRVLLIILLVIAVFLFLRIIRRKYDRKAMLFALAINIVASIHALLYCFVFLAPIHIILLNHRRVWGLLLTGVAFVDLLLIWLGWGGYLYPLITLLVLMIIELKEHPLKSNKLQDLHNSYP